MKKKAIAVFLLIIMLLSLSACWNKVEPKELGIITSIVYDVGEKDKYKIIIEILNPMTSTSQSSAGTSKPCHMLKPQGTPQKHWHEGFMALTTR